jgi:hypothetical protein
MITAAFAACGGGSVNTTPLAPGSTQSGNTSTSSNTTLPSAGAGGITASVTFPSTSSTTTITESVNVHPFGSTPVLSTDRVAESGSRSPLAAVAPSPLLYVQFVSSSSVTVNGTPGVTFTLPSITAGTSYFLATYGQGGWTYPAEGPGTVSGSTVSFPINTSNNATITISPTAPIEVALYSLTGPALSPTTLTFDAGNPTSAPFTVTEPGDTAAFTAAMSCTVASPVPSPSPSSSSGPSEDERVPTIVVASPTPSPSPTATFVAQLGASSASPTGGVASFTVTSGSQPGSCSVVVSDSQNATSTETVNVDQTTLGIYSVQRAAAQGVH